MPSVIRGGDNFDSQEVVSGTAKAWVNFSGSGTVAIRASYNVSSITDRGTGLFTVNLTTSMADSNYATLGTAQNSSEGSPRNTHASPFDSSSYYISIENHLSTYSDALYISSCVLR
jgi:hypothetical protein